MGKNLDKKPKALTSIKKRTSAAAQSKQISALSRQLTSMSKKQFAKVHTVWQRNLLTCETATGGVYAYICPIPYAPGNPTGASQPGGVTTWTDNLSLAAQPTFAKKAVFGVAREAATSNEIYHTGGCIKWQMTTNEPGFSKYGLFLIRPKKAMADQLVKDRLLKQGSALNPTLGFASFLREDLDYIVHSEGVAGGTSYGSQINTKYWDVLYRREVTLGNPLNLPFNGTQIPGGNNFPENNAVTAKGTITLPAGGMIKNAADASQQGGGNASQATSWEVGYGDQENETGVFLVCINNGISVDGEAGKLGFLVHDYYKACV